MKYNEGLIGLISGIDAAKMLVKVTYYESENFTTDWLPLLVIPGTFYMPKVQDQVFVFMDESFNTGIVMGGVYNPPQFDKPELLALKFPGVEITINKDTGEVKVTGDKITVIGSDVTLQADNTIITGKLEVRGDVAMKAKAAITSDLSVQGDTSSVGKITAVGVIKSNTDVKTLTVSLNQHMHPTAALGPPSPPIPIPQT